MQFYKKRITISWMQTIVDSHCHLQMLDLVPYKGDLQIVLDEAKSEGVGHFLCVSIALKDAAPLKQIAKKHQNVSISVGIHPNEENEPLITVDKLCQLAEDDKVIAIGETGLDYYRNEGDMAWQHDRFRLQIRAARELNKPLIIHTRQAREDTIKILKEEGAKKVGGVFHCFTEDWQMAKAGLDLNFSISFSGIVTFKNAKQVHEVAEKVPIEQLLVETDAPYLAPHPYRGKANYPKYVRLVAEKIAELKKLDVSTVASQTTENFSRLFNVVL